MPQGIALPHDAPESPQEHIESSISLGMNRHLVSSLIKFLDFLVDPILIVIQYSRSTTASHIWLKNSSGPATHTSIQKYFDGTDLDPLRAETPIDAC